MKLKPILPSLKERKRYIVFEVVSATTQSFETIKEKINKALLAFLGELGCAKAGIIVLNEWKNNRGIIKVNNKEVDKVKAALTLIKNSILIKCIYVTGLLNKAKLKMEV